MKLATAEVIVALAENCLSISKAAKKIYKHRNTVVYQVEKIQRETGKNPLDFYDMLELLPIAKKVLEE